MIRSSQQSSKLAKSRGSVQIDTKPWFLLIINRWLTYKCSPIFLKDRPGGWNGLISCLLPQYINLVLYRQQQIHCYKCPKLSSYTCLTVRQVQLLSSFVLILYSLVLSCVQMQLQMHYELVAQYSIFVAHTILWDIQILVSGL